MIFVHIRKWLSGDRRNYVIEALVNFYKTKFENQSSILVSWTELFVIISFYLSFAYLRHNVCFDSFTFGIILNWAVFFLQLSTHCINLKQIMRAKYYYIEPSNGRIFPTRKNRKISIYPIEKYQRRMIDFCL